MGKKYYHYFLLSLLIGVLFWFGYQGLQMPMIAEGDAYARALIANGLIARKLFFEYTINSLWPPLHFTLLNLPSWLGVNLMFGQRLASLIFSLLSVVALYFYSYEHLKKRNLALLASVLFGLLPLRHFISTQTLSEGVFIFFLLMTNIFLLKKRHLNRNTAVATIFLFLAGLIRFEAWLFLPVMFSNLVVSNQLSFKQKLACAWAYLTPFLIVLWLNLKSFGTAFPYFELKYLIAQATPIPEYYHLQLTLTSWLNQLFKAFPFFFLILIAPAYRNLMKKLTPQKALFYLTPLYFYLLLILQVYLGTMEWFPMRYLLIPIVFVIPILAKVIWEIGEFSVKYFKSRAGWWPKALLVILLILLLILAKESYFEAREKTKLQLTTLSFLSVRDETELDAPRQQKYADFFLLLETIKKLGTEKIFIEYYYSETERSWQDQALFYLLETFGVDSAKSKYQHLHQPENLVVWEKEPATEKERWWRESFEIIYENSHYLIIK